jgi:hypothetical protein
MRTTRASSLRLCLLLALSAVAALALSGTAGARPAGPPAPADIVTTIAPPASAAVYTSARWRVTVANPTNKNAYSVVVTVQLPRTANSPTQYVMGTVGAMHGNCVRSGFTIVCQANTVGRFSSKTFWFDMTLPYSTNPITFTASAPLANDPTPTNNTASAAATLSTVAIAFTAPRTAVATMCTGNAALSSFIECVPGSTQTLSIDLLPGTTATSGPISTIGGGGTWTLSGTQLAIDLMDGTTLGASFVGQGVNAICWEGKTTFPSSTQYVSMYRVCLQ